MTIRPGSALLLLFTLAAQGQTPATVPALRNFAQLPLAFARSQSGGRHRYIARGQGYRVSLDSARAAVAVTSGSAGKTVSLEFAGSHPGQLTAGPELPGKINLIQGNDPKQWQLGLSTYGRVSWPNVYPGIDVVYYGNQQQLEFDLVVKPGADPGRIRMKVSGAEKLSVDGSGALDLGEGAGGLRVALPKIYQDVNGARRDIRGHYAISGKNEVAFRVDPWDRTQPLVIDPTISLSTVFGGGNGNTTGFGIQLDSGGNILIAGSTSASDFPVANAAQITLNGINGNSNAFVTKLNPTATSLIYSTYLGGSGGDQANALAVDSTGSAWITGATQSTDFPLLNPAQATAPVTSSGGSAAFVTRLSSSGVLQFSTYLASSDGNQGNGIAVDASQNGYVTGYSSGTFPTTTGVVNSTNQSYDAFVTKYTSAGAVAYSTLLGGSDIDGAFAIAVDSTGAAYVTGISQSSTFNGAPTGGAQTTNNGVGDVFVAKLSADATSLVYFTFLGGAGSDLGNAITLDSSLNAYIAGQTESTGLATTEAAQTTLNGSSNGFVAKLNAAGSSFSYVSYIGGTRVDKIAGIAPDGFGNVYVTGQSDSSNFPAISAVQSALAGNQVGLFSSADSGATWTAIDSSLPAGTYDFSINPADTSAVALTESGIYRTTNGGTSWSLKTGAQSLVQNPFRGDWGSAFVSRSPASASTIYAAVCCTTIFKSTDDGVTWNATSGSPSTDPLGIVADPLTAGTVYVFGNGFPYVFKSTDGGNTWGSAASGLPGNQVVAMAAGSDGSLYLDTQNGGLYKSTNHAGSWTTLSGLSGTFNPNPFSLSVSGTTVYFVSAGNFYKSTNGGTSWTTSTAPGGGVGEVAASPQSPLVVYVYSYNNAVYASADGGATWSGPGTGFSESDYTSQELVVDPGNSAHVVVVSPVNQGAVVAKVKSDGSAFTWSTYLGGTYGAQGKAVTTDGAGDAFVTGNSSGGAFPVTVAGSANYGTFLTEISDATGDCNTLTVSPSTAFAGEYGGQLSFSVLAPSGCAWTASINNQSWAVILSGTSGTGSGTITVGSVPVGNNLGYSAALLTVGSQTVTITQPTNSCAYILNKTLYGVPQAGGTVTANLSAQSAFAVICPWQVTNNDPNAVTVTSPTPAQGVTSATITLTVAANPDLNGRSFSLPVGSTTLNIVQAGTCTYQLSATSVSVAQAGVTGNTVTVTPSSALCTWSASTNNGGFLNITSGFSGTGTGTVTYNVLSDPTNPRTGTLTIAGLTFTVNQTGIIPGYLISTLTGGKGPAATIAGASTAFGAVTGVAADSAGNTYIAVPQLNAVYRLDGTGSLTRFAGTGVPGFSGDGGAATSAQLSNPHGIAVDTSGNVYIADSANQRIRKVTAAGTITTAAGNGINGFAGDGGAAALAELSNPIGVATDSSGNLYIADTGNNRIRRSSGNISTVVGPGTQNFLAGGGQTVVLNSPQGVVVDSHGDIYIADTGNNRVVELAATASTVAGSNVCCNVNDGGPATNAWLASPQGVTLDSSGNLFIADTNNSRVREVTSNGIINTIAGSGNYGFKGDGGVATGGQLRSPIGLAFDQSGNLLIADQYNQRVRKVSGGTITTVVGGGANGDGGPVSFATVGIPGSVAQDASGNFFIADTANNVVREISVTGVISTVAGTGVQGYSGDGAAANAAMLNQPQSVTVDTNGNLYIYDSGNDRIRKVDSGGKITTIAGNGTCCYSGDGGTATGAQISYGYGVAVDGSGNIYIADTNNHRVREISGGNITTVAGNGTAGYSGDSGAATSAQLNNPYGVALNPAGTNLYIADSSNHRIRKVSGGTITTVAGNGTNAFSGDGGAATSAQINNPRGVAIDGSGNLYIADSNNNRVREVLSSGTIVTLAGTGGGNYSGDGGLSTSATFRTPQDVIVDGSGNLYVADTYNSAIRLLTPGLPVLVISSVHSGSFSAGGTGSYTLTVGNASATATSGTVTVTEILPSSLTLNSMSGTGWACTGNSCTRSDALIHGTPYPAITVSVIASSTAPSQVTNEATASGGGAFAVGTEDLTLVTPAVPSAPVLTAPANGATNVSLFPMLTWTAATEATSYAVYFGTVSTPTFLANTTDLSFTPPQLTLNTTYYWQVVATNSAGTTPSAVFSFTTYGSGFCTFALSPGASAFGTIGGTGSVTLTTAPGCVWGAIGSQAWLALASAPQGSGNGTVLFSVAPNTGAARSATLTIGGQTFTVNQTANYLVSTLIGGKQPAVAATATTVTLTAPDSVATDSAGNTYFAATQLNAVYRLDAGGTLTQIAGTGAIGYSGDAGPATSAMLNQPHGVAVDAFGDVFIADSGNNRIREVTPAGIITTVAGTGQCCFFGDGGQGTSAWLNYPTAVTLDSTGNLYISDTNNNRIREVSNGLIITIAGNGSYGYSGDGSSATSAQMESPQGVAVDASGNIYVSDTNNGRVRKISGGNINAFAGTGVCCTLGDNGAATSAWLANPLGLAVDSQNNVYIADSNNHRIREVSGGNIGTVAGNGNYSFTGDGATARNATLRTPSGVAFDSAGNMLIADQNNQRIRKVIGGNIGTVAGGGPNGDGGAVPFANLAQPVSVAKDSSGNVYIADAANNRIRKISAAGVVSTVAGTGVQGYSGDGAAATAAMLSQPQAVALDSSGNLFIYDSGNDRIRKVDSSGNINTVAGNGTCCYSGDGASATAAQINYGNGLAIDGSGNIYIADTNNQRIRKVSGGNITTVAGNGTYGYTGDTGSAMSAELANPAAVAVDGSGNIFIADSGNNRVREVSGGNIDTIAGNGTCCFSGDSGLATSAQLNSPRAVMADSAGNIYITDYNNRVREITGAGTIVTVAGNGNYLDSGDGGPAVNATFRTPQGMALDSSGNIYVADTNNNAVRMLTPAATSPVLSITSAHTGNFTAAGTGSYTLTVANAANAGPTTGTVTVTAIPPAGLTLNSMSGGGWSCTGALCTRSDPLNGGATYTSITMSVATLATAPFEVTNEVTVSGGGSNAAAASEDTIVAQPAASLTALSPNFVAAGGPAVPVTVTGAGITTGSAISFSLNSTTTSLPALWQSATQAVVSIPAALLTATGYAQIAMINPSGASSNSLPFTISTNTPQTITFPALSDVPMGTPSVTVNATSSSGLTVTYASSTPNFCSVSGTTVTILASGGCAITASQPGDTTYGPAAPVTQKFTIMFGDIAPTDHYYAAINAMAQHGITNGCGNNDYCPNENITRDQMAIFIVRAIYGNDNFTYNTTPYFTDVTPTTFGFKWIQKMKELSITNGCTATTYCPLETVSRDQMAIFIIRARLGLALAGGQNPSFTYPSTPYFTDVPVGAFGYQWIQRMKEEGITNGCTATTYCASEPIIRGDMAIFIMRGAFNQFLPAGTPLVSQISPSTIAPGTSGTYTITGTNTNFVQGTTQLSPIPDVTIGTITVTGPTTMTVQLTAAPNAVQQPYSILAITNTEEAVLPNGLSIQ